MSASSLIKTINYATSGNFNFDSSLIEFASSRARLKLIVSNLLKTQAFTSSTGFTFDSTKTEFTGTVLQQKKFQVGSMDATFDFGKDADTGNGTLTATLANGATVSAGELDLTGGASKRWQISGDQVTNLQLLTQDVEWIPNYSGFPASVQVIMGPNGDLSNLNQIVLTHDDITGNMRLIARDNIGTTITSANIKTAFSAVSGQKYNVRLVTDFTGGTHRLFIDGTFQGKITGVTGTMNQPDLFKLGQGFSNNVLIDMKIGRYTIYESLLNTDDLNYTVSTPFLFRESSADLPAFAHSQQGTYLSYVSLVTTETGSVRYSIKSDSGSFKYWTGSAWAISDGTYAQASSKSDITTNLVTLTDANGATSVTIRVHFKDDTSQSNIDNLDFTISSQTVYSTANPSLIENSGVEADALDSFAETTSIVAGSDDIRYIIQISGQDKYWNGSAWVNSDGTFAQANTPDVVETNKAALDLSSGGTIKIKTFLHSNDGTTTPEIEVVTLGYNFFNTQTTPATCTIWGFYRDLSGVGVSGATVTFSLKKTAKQYREAGDSVIEKTVSATTDSNGRFEKDLIRSSAFEGAGTYEVVITGTGLETSQIDSAGTKLEFTVPDLSDKNITDLITAIA